MSRKPIDLTAILLMLLACSIWAIQPIGLKATTHNASPVLQIGLRSGIAAFLVFCVIRFRGERLVLSRRVLLAGMSAGLLFAFEFLLVGESLKHTSASHVVVFLYTAPIFAALGLHWKFASERLAPFQWLGIGLAAAGIAITFFGHGSDAASPDLGSMVLGDLMALVGGAAWGSTTIVIRSTGLATIPATQTLLYQLVSAFVVLVGAAVLMGQAHVEFSLALIANLAFQGVVVSFFSFLVWFWLLTKYLASQLGVFSFLTPMFGVVLGWLLLHEPVSRQFLIGAITVLVGIVLVSGYPWFRQLIQRGGGVKTAP